MILNHPLNSNMQDIIDHLIVKEKGILAIDESFTTIGKRFATINVENTEQNRCRYRSLLATTKNLSDYISGVILFEETLTQKIYLGGSATKVLDHLAKPDDIENNNVTIAEKFRTMNNKNNILIGLKVDQGLVSIYPNSLEKIAKGLDNLVDNIIKYKEYGIQFAKWRSVISVNHHSQLPSKVAIHINSEQLARYAAICQNLGIIPIVEPEVLMDGDHDLETCAAINEKFLFKVFQALRAHKVQLEYIILKTNMIVPGKECKQVYSHERIAESTLKVLKTTVPALVPSINFLSGGQSEEAATANLNAMNKLGIANGAPWHLSFSFGRALQESCLKVWNGEDANIKVAQAALLERSRLNSLANLGQL